MAPNSTQSARPTSPTTSCLSGTSAGFHRARALGFFVLVGMPILAVVAVLIEEIRGRDWTFVAVALVVLGLIGYSAYSVLH